MKKYLLILTFIGLFIFLTACADISKPPSEEPTQPTVEDGWQDLEEGNVVDAKSTFEQILNEDPDNPEANAGMAIIKTYEFREKFYNILESIQNSVSLFPTPSQSFASSFFTFPTYASLEVSTPLLNQDEIDSAILELEDIEEYLDKALNDPDISYRLYINKFDWDGDGEVEPTKSMKVVDVRGNVYDIKDVLYSEQPEGEGPFVVLQDGGDAWFDFEWFRAKFREEELPNEIVFDDNDYITIDDGTLYLLRFFIKSALAFMRLLATWDLSLPADFPMPEGPNDFNWFSDVLDYLDENDDMIIAGGEWQGLDPFLEFRENGSENLQGFVDALVKSIESILEADEDSESDTGDEHDITSQEYLPKWGLLEDVIEDRFRDFLENLDMEIDVNGDGDVDYTLHFGVLGEYPDRFSDLKDFFPSVQFVNVNGITYPFSTGELPDPTFGGFVTPGIDLIPAWK